MLPIKRGLKIILKMIAERKPTVLITGGSGMIGMHLTSALLSAGYNVSHLSRGQEQFGKVRVFRWDPERGILDPKAFIGTDHIVHLAGVNIGERRWTERRKEEIRKSRIDSASLIHKIIRENGLKINTFISASGISYYGTLTSDKIFTENDPPAADFLGNICREWEEAADLFAKDGIRTVKIRSAVVLEKDDIAMTRITMPARFGFLGQAGNGRQYMPWIHIKDLCNIYLKSIEDQEMKGAYNAVSTQDVTHKEFIKTLSSVIKRPVFPVAVPALLLKILFGDMADLVLKGSRVSSEKILNAGYEFEFSDISKAIGDILNRL